MQRRPLPQLRAAGIGFLMAVVAASSPLRAAPADETDPSSDTIDACRELLIELRSTRLELQRFIDELTSASLTVELLLLQILSDELHGRCGAPDEGKHPSGGSARPGELEGSPE